MSDSTDITIGAEAAEPQILVGLSFPDQFRAQEFLTAAGGLAAKGALVMRDAVIVTKAADGRTHVRETTDPKPSQAALSGGVWTGLIGLLLAGPIGWLAGTAIGAGAGAIGAHVIDLGVSDEWVEWFQQAVQPDTATVILLVSDLDREALITEAARFTGAQLVYANLDDRTLERITSALGQTPLKSTSPED